MLLRSSITLSMALSSFLVVSSLAQAGSSSTVIVTVGPLATSSVPTLSGNLLIVLGLLLSVIAARTLRNQRGAQKLLSLLVLGGGLIVSGIGADRTLAIIENVLSAKGTVCTEPGELPGYNGAFNSAPTKLQNDCASSIKIIGFSSPCGTDLATGSAGCKVNDVLTAGSSCSYLPQCIAPG